MVLDLIFPVRGDRLPLDHAYALYAALSGLMPALHQHEPRVFILPVNGVPSSPHELQLTEHSQLRLRLPDDHIRTVLPLASKKLDIAGHSIRLGVPSVATLVPAATLFARIVTFKYSWRSPRELGHNADRPNLAALPATLAEASGPNAFLAAVRRLLTEHSIDGEATITLTLSGPHAGQPRRRVVRIKSRAIVGYSLIVSGLSAEHSLRLQELGLGGRGRIGCGFFLPIKEGGK